MCMLYAVASVAITVLLVAVTSGQGIRVHVEIGNSFGCCLTCNICITALLLLLTFSVCCLTF